MRFDGPGNRQRVAALQERGVRVWGPERVYVAKDLDLEAVEPGAEIRQATLSGPDTSVAKGAVIGASGHAEVRDCQIGRDVELGAGYYHGATFLEGAKVRGFAEIRPGTLMEERSEAAHSVALKNTVFTTWCVAGSLINFCDLFLSGGLSRKDHTEVGSGAIHFNFDPRGDKWGSLVGGVRGVLLQSEPVFVGGQCGLVGPVEIGFGAVTAAGTVIRRDVGGRTVASDLGKAVRSSGFDRRIYGPVTRRFLATAKLVGTLRALDAWYAAVRIPHASSAERGLYTAARKQIDRHARERVKRLGRIVDKLPLSIELSLQRGATDADAVIAAHRAMVERWDRMQSALSVEDEPPRPPQAFLDAYAEARGEGRSHIAAVQAAAAEAESAALWLDGIVEGVVRAARDALQQGSTGGGGA